VSILFVDGFENYAQDEDLAGMWVPQGTIQFLEPGRDPSGSAVSMNTTVDFLNHALGGLVVTGVTGFAFKHVNGAVGTLPIVRLMEANALSSGQHLEVNIVNGNLLTLQRGTTTIDTSVKTLANNVWYYIEVKWTIDNAAGSCEVFVNGTKGGWLDFSGDTQNGGLTGVDAVKISGTTTGTGGAFHFDDFYALDNSGGAPGNDRLGDSIVETLNPSGVGAEAQWTPSAGANQENVDEATPDDDTTFNSSGIVDDDDRFAMDNLVNIPSTVFGVQVNGMFRNENSGARSIRLKAHDGVTEGQSDTRATTFDPAYVFEFQVFEDHPTDANPWSTAEVNAMEAGYRIQA
jgi:hypothetical protein